MSVIVYTQRKATRTDGLLERFLEESGARINRWAGEHFSDLLRDLHRSLHQINVEKIALPHRSLLPPYSLRANLLRPPALDWSSPLFGAWLASLARPFALVSSPLAKLS